MFTKLLLTKHTLKMTTLSVALVSCATAASADDAADYPTKPIQFLVAAGAGGGVDNFARVVRPMFEEALGGHALPSLTCLPPLVHWLTSAPPTVPRMGIRWILPQPPT